jgi:hypothetical protein
MMSKTLGARSGGTTRGAHHALESDAFSLITPPNSGGVGGLCFPVIVVVAPGAPGVPVICWANTEETAVVPTKSDNDSTTALDCIFVSDARRDEWLTLGDLAGLGFDVSQRTG